MHVHAVHALKVRCRFCSQFRHPNEFIVNSTVGYCLRCYEWHQKALASLESGDPPAECARCERPTHLLPRDANGDLRMQLHPMDGLYAFLCLTCSDEYERKRLDLYGDTPHGHARGLKTKT